LIVALLLGIPVGYSLGIATVLGLLLTPLPLVYIAQTFYTGVGLFPLIAIPGFILAGMLMERSGLTDRIIRVVYIVAGNVPGGLAVVTMLSCMFFASLTGSGPATTAAVGGVMIPAMLRAGYPVSFAAAGLFLAGVLPGLMIGLGLTVYCLLIGARRGYRATGERFAWRAFLVAVWRGKFALMMPVIVLGTIYGGVATPTEASMLAVVYAIALGLISRNLTLRDLAEAAVNTGKLTGAVLIILGPAMAFGKLLTLYEIPNQISLAITTISDNPLIVLVLISLFLVFVGTFMETLSTIVLLTPVFLPVLAQLGVDPVQFGILFVVLSEVGFLTPPLGVNLYVASAISNIGIEPISRAVIPFLVILLMFCGLLILFPWLSTVGYYQIVSR
jgi:C4-dicarboxylate transporter DctM subunit